MLSIEGAGITQAAYEGNEPSQAALLLLAAACGFALASTFLFSASHAAVAVAMLAGQLYLTGGRKHTGSREVNPPTRRAAVWRCI